VVAAVELHHVVDAAAEQIGGLALALVAPLGSDQDDRWHRGPLLSWRAVAPLYRRPSSTGPRLPTARPSWKRVSTPCSSISAAIRRRTVRRPSPSCRATASSLKPRDSSSSSRRSCATPSW